MNFSFAGCGFLGIYHVGVAACLKKYAPNLLLNKISGASAGALAAVCLLCDSPLGTITSSVLKTATEARRRTLGPFSPTFNIEKLLREGLLSVLPDDAHLIVSGKLFISVTRISDGKNILLSQFDTKEDLIQINLANTSIELSKENLYRFARILFPPPPKVLNKMCQQGFNDALDFLQRNNLINCTRCLAVQSRFNLTESHEAHNGSVHEMDCFDCHQQRKEAIIDQLPEAVGSILQDAINKANQGLMNWVFKHKSMKLLSILTLPYVLPFDVAYAAFLKFMGSAPTASDIKNLANQIISLVQALIRSSKQSPLHHRHRHESKFSCQLAITQFSGEVEMQHLQNRHNFDFTLDLDDVKGVPQSHKDAMQLESQALTEVALRCASRSISRAGSRMASRAASRAVSRAVSRRPSLNDVSDPSLYDLVDEIPTGHISDDAFEQILDVTTHQEALMAYYYLDDNNEVQVTEIFDLTRDENSAADDGGIEMDNSHWDLQREMQTRPWSLNMRNDSISSERGFEVEVTVASDTESEHYHRGNIDPEADQVVAGASSSSSRQTASHFNSSTH
ncbi:patatin-like phospholipase domain-containing protein 2 isoform X5 [Procambarus clarkii]|uniref:patatin-like phospholipase domain-containing protein 2 isoform X5 n=1 Tax=Procambarus clarkii TaxID=6728 RepID=UPI0037421E97